jgi:hypothetical protein
LAVLNVREPCVSQDSSSAVVCSGLLLFSWIPNNPD